MALAQEGGGGGVRSPAPRLPLWKHLWPHTPKSLGSTGGGNQRGEGRGNWGLPRWSRRFIRQKRLQSRNFYRADSERGEQTQDQSIIKSRISASSKAGPPRAGASLWWGRLPLIEAGDGGPQHRSSERAAPQGAS